PVGCVEWRPPDGTTERQLAWSAYLLPYLEQQPLYDRLDLSQAFDAPHNAEPAATVLPVYLCPSSKVETTRIEGRGRTDYGGMYGERITDSNDLPVKFVNGQPVKQPEGTMLFDV